MSAARGSVERWLSVADVAGLLGVGKKTARAWAADGKLGRVVDLGGPGWRVAASGVAAFLAGREIVAGGDAPQVTPEPVGIAARSDGELQRKLERAGLKPGAVVDVPGCGVRGLF